MQHQAHLSHPWMTSLERELDGMLAEAWTDQMHERRLRELSHRYGNMLQIVLSIARRSFDEADGVKEGLECLERRLVALAAANRILVDPDVPRAGAMTSCINALEPFGYPCSRIEIAGPSAILSEASVTKLTLALYELATNASKYGALSNADGRVSLTWERVETGFADPRLRFRWSERGSPSPADRPARRGQGSKMLAALLSDRPGAAFERSFADDGVACSFLLAAEKADGGRTAITQAGGPVRRYA